MADNETSDISSYISKITLPSGSTYSIKDAKAWEDIATLSSLIQGGVHYIGKTTTELSDGATTNPVTIGGTSVSAEQGDLVSYSPGEGKNDLEFIWDGSRWNELGSSGALKAFAFVDKGEFSTSYTPAGTFSADLANGSAAVSASYTPAGSIELSSEEKTLTSDYTPAGTISQLTFTGDSLTSNGSFTPQGSLSVETTTKTVAVSKVDSGAVTYTPEGTVAAPTISVSSAGSTTTINNPIAKPVIEIVDTAEASSTDAEGELKYCSVVDEILTLSKFTALSGYSITTSGVAVKTGDAAYSATAPKFTGTGARLVTGDITVPTGNGTFTGTEGSVSVSGIPSGTVSQPTFNGTQATITSKVDVPVSAAFTGTAATIESSGNVTGSVSGSIVGTQATISAEVSPKASA